MGAMAIDEFARIKEKIEKCKVEKAKTAGAIEAIQKEWESDYGFSDVENAKIKLSYFDDEISALEKRIKIIDEKLEGLTDWESLDL